MPKRQLKAHEFTTDKDGKFLQAKIEGTITLIKGKPWLTQERTKPPGGRLTRKEQEAKARQAKESAESSTPKNKVNK